MDQLQLALPVIQTRNYIIQLAILIVNLDILSIQALYNASLILHHLVIQPLQLHHQLQFLHLYQPQELEEIGQEEFNLLAHPMILY